MMIAKLRSKKYIIVGLTSKTYHSDIEEKNFRLATEYKSLFFSASSALTNSFGVNVPPDMMNGAVLPTIAIADRRSKGLVKLIGHHPLE